MKTEINTKPKKKRRLTRRRLEIYSMTVIPLLYIFIFCYLPFYGIIIAFKNYKFSQGIFGSEWCGFDNFKFLFLSQDFTNAVKNTLIMNLIFIATGTIAALLIAILMYNVKSRHATKVYQTVLLTPHYLSWVIGAYVVYALLQPQSGLVNTMLHNLGFTGVDWYNKPGVWPVVLTICNIWKHIGMDSIFYYAALMGIDEALLEAAEIDGANGRKKVYYVMIPEILSIVVMLTIMKFGGIFHADFGLFYQVPRNLPALYSTTDVLDTFVFRSMRELGDMGMSSAAGLLQSVVGFVLLLTVNKLSKKISEEGALF